jgi:heme exporter protein A
MQASRPSSGDPSTPALLEARGLAFARNDEPIFGQLDFAVQPVEVVMI